MFTTGNEWGSVGGSAKTEAKKKSSRENGKKGGRPKHGAEYAVEYYCIRRKRKVMNFFSKNETAMAFYLKKDCPTMYFYFAGKYKKVTPTEKSFTEK